MKKLILSAALAVGTLAGPASADDYAFAHEFCGTLSDIAHGAMTMRQTGTSRAQAELLLFDSSPAGPVREAVLIIIRDAYAYPQLHSMSVIEKAAADFRVEKYNECMYALAPNA